MTAATKFALAGALATMAFGSALAQSRPNLRQATCASGQQLIAAAGAIVVDTGPLTYERVVTSAQYCDRREALLPVWTPTHDQPQCPIGFRCGPSVSSNSR